MRSIRLDSTGKRTKRPGQGLLALVTLVLSLSGGSIHVAAAADNSALPGDEVRLSLDPAELTAFLEQARVELKMPGLRAAVRLPDGQVVRAAVGLADKEANIPLDDTIGMPGGSTGKTFVAALTMLLVEDGVLSLDDPASKWLGDRPWFHRLPNADDIRVRHLLSHTAGIGDYPETVGYYASMTWRVIRRGSAKFEPEELIGFVLDRKPPFDVGEGFHYTDPGYLVLGRLIEAASGRTYYDLLEERILDPLGLDEVHPARESVLPNIATGYTAGARNLKKDGRMKFDPSSEWTGGGLTTNPTMLVEFLAALAEGRVVQPESLEKMVNGGWRNPETPGLHYGFGLFVENSGESFGHGGLWPGYRTHVGHDVRTGTTIAVQTNRDGRLDLRELVGRIGALLRLDLVNTGPGSARDQEPSSSTENSISSTGNPSATLMRQICRGVVPGFICVVNQEQVRGVAALVAEAVNVT